MREREAEVVMRALALYLKRRRAGAAMKTKRCAALHARLHFAVQASGTRYIRKGRGYCGSALALAISAYNAGPHVTTYAQHMDSVAIEAATRVWRAHVRPMATAGVLQPFTAECCLRPRLRVARFMCDAFSGFEICCQTISIIEAINDN